MQDTDTASNSDLTAEIATLQARVELLERELAECKRARAGDEPVSEHFGIPPVRRTTPDIDTAAAYRHLSLLVSLALAFPYTRAWEREGLNQLPRFDHHEPCTIAEFDDATVVLRDRELDALIPLDNALDCYIYYKTNGAYNADTMAALLAVPDLVIDSDSVASVVQLIKETDGKFWYVTDEELEEMNETYRRHGC